MTPQSKKSKSDFDDFECTRCGACCRSVAHSPLTQWLDSGDGVCRHLDRNSNMCLIYDSRPDVCRVDVQYVRFYKDIYSWKRFCDLNRQCCEILQKRQAEQDAAKEAGCASDA